MIKVNSTHIIFVVIVIIIIAAVFYGYFNLQNSGGGGPRIRFTPRSYDFGDIQPQLVEHTFVVKNIGNAPLLIKKVTTSCACTKATIDSEEILPNQTANLLVTFDPNLMEEEVKGNVLRIVYIKSNDPEKPEVEIEIKANVL